MEDKIIRCTAQHCIYRSSCGRQVDEEPPSKEQECCNFEIDCLISNEYGYYIKKYK